jgi:hypothetical protein
MPETYRSFGTILGTTASTTIYSGITGTAIVNGVVFSNVNTAIGTTITLNLVIGSTAYSLITNADVPIKASLQALDSPVVLNSSNTLTAQAGITGAIHAIVSVLEIT